MLLLAKVFHHNRRDILHLIVIIRQQTSLQRQTNTVSSFDSESRGQGGGRETDIEIAGVEVRLLCHLRARGTQIVSGPRPLNGIAN